MKLITTILLLLIFSTYGICQRINVWINDTSQIYSWTSYLRDTIYDIRNISDGEWEIFYDKEFQKPYMTLNVENGKKRGELTRYYRNGKEKSKTIFDIHSNDSIYSEWSINGDLTLISYKDRANEHTVIFFDDGTIKEETFFDENMIMIKFEYYENSKLKKITTSYNCSDNNLFNKTIEYDHAGTKSIERTWKIIKEEAEDPGSYYELMIDLPIKYYINGIPVGKDVFESNN